MDQQEQKKESLRLQVLEKTIELMTAAFSLVAALAWNDAIQSLFKLVFGEAGSIYIKFFYAALVTALIVALTQWLRKVKTKIGEKFQKKEG